MRRYPGSPWLIAEALRPRRPATWLRAAARTSTALLSERAAGPGPSARTLCGGRLRAARGRATPAGRLLVLIDPPFERRDDYARIVETLAAVLRRNRSAPRSLVWLPLKDLETFDAFLRDLEDAVDAPRWSPRRGMRPLTDPMKMNGCALVIPNPPPGFEAPLREIAEWVVKAAGGPEGGPRSGI